MRDEERGERTVSDLAAEEEEGFRRTSTWVARALTLDVRDGIEAAFNEYLARTRSSGCLWTDGALA